MDNGSRCTPVGTSAIPVQADDSHSITRSFDRFSATSRNGYTKATLPMCGTYDFELITAKLIAGVAALMSNVFSIESVSPASRRPRVVLAKSEFKLLRLHEVVVKYRLTACDAETPRRNDEQGRFGQDAHRP